MKPYDYAVLCKQAYTTVPTFGNVNSAGRAVVYGDVLVFRGSDDISSWLHDLDAVTIDVGQLGEVHAGFWSAYLEIRAQVLAMRPKVVTGHSLGAALAIIAAADLQISGWQVAEVHAFEPPRVSTDSAINQILHDVSPKLYKNGNDLVPDLPIGLPFEEWQHCAPLIRIGKPAEPYPNITDHLIDNVVAAMAERLKNV